jgi:hypothetical protein
VFGKEIVQRFRHYDMQSVPFVDGENLELVAHLLRKMHGDRALTSFFFGSLGGDLGLEATRAAGSSGVAGLWRELPPVSARSSIEFGLAFIVPLF